MGISNLSPQTDRSIGFNLFFQDASDAESFIFRGINLAKLFYDRHASKARTLQSDSQRVRRATIWDLILYCGRFFQVPFVVWKWKKRNRGSQAYIFFGASRITRMHGSIYDLYNPKIVEAIGRERILLIERHKNNTRKTYLPDLYATDLFPIIRILDLLCRLLLGSQIHSFHNRLRRCNPKFKISEQQTKRIVADFYSKFLAQRSLLRLASPDCVLLICHYGLNAFIAACKDLKIKTIELMHGSILKLHPHYNAPEASPSFRAAFSRFMLPDEIGVYGLFWKQNLLAGSLFAEKDVFILGYYLQAEQPMRFTRKDDKIVLLISTQAPFQRIWIDYLETLKRNLPMQQWRIIIKPHPAEKDEEYRKLACPGFLEVSHDSVYALLNRADIHMSVRSTVLFEALRYGVANYILVVDSVARECQEMIDSGIGLPIHTGQLPAVAAPAARSSSYFFASFDPKLLIRHLSAGSDE